MIDRSTEAALVFRHELGPRQFGRRRWRRGDRSEGDEGGVPWPRRATAQYWRRAGREANRASTGRSAIVPCMEIGEGAMEGGAS
jgi:hypothetical protein